MEKGRIAHFPISFFSVTMGLGGFAIATQKVELLYGWGHAISASLVLSDMLIFLVITLLYAAKTAMFFKNVQNEIANPTKLSFFPTVSIAMLLLSIALLPLHPDGSKILWYAAALLHLIFTLSIISSWIRQSHYEIQHFSPAWFIPVVGNLIVPIAGVEHAPVSISWFFYAVGLIFWIMLFAIVLYRLFFHKTMPEKLMPTMFILMAPPAIACIAWMRLGNSFDPFALIMLNFSLFMFFLMVSMITIFTRIKFYLSWWAYSFPVAAVSIAFFAAEKALNTVVYGIIGTVLWAVLSLLIIGLVTRTIYAVVRKEICVEEH